MLEHHLYWKYINAAEQQLYQQRCPDTPPLAAESSLFYHIGRLQWVCKYDGS
jgi:hypothetical protein